jgi:hypothetical protein
MVQVLGGRARCIHVGDCESDIYELYCLAKDLNTKFLLRAQADRLSAQTAQLHDEPQWVRARLVQVPWAGTHEVDIAGKDSRMARLQVKFATIETLPHIGQQKRYTLKTLT